MNTFKTPSLDRTGRRRLFAAVAVAALALPVAALASPVDIPNQFSTGDAISAAEFNENFDAIADAINDNDTRLEAVEAAVAGAGVPVGTIAFFAASTCPAGWSEHADLRGRVPLGLPTSGTVSGMVGSPLGDEGSRTITQVPSHRHGVSLAGNSGTDGGHTPTMSDAGSHRHGIRVENDNNYSSSYTRGASNASGGSVSTSPMDFAGTHSHPMDAVPDHSHSVSLSGNSDFEGVASVDVTMPYVQLLACQRT